MKNNGSSISLPSGISLNISIDELISKIRCVDIIGLDVDNCLLDGHGQIHVGLKLLPDIVKVAFRRFPLGTLMKIGMGICGLSMFKLKKILGTQRFNLFIMHCFAKTLEGVDKESFEKAVCDFENFLRPGAREAVIMFAGFAPVVLLSLGIEPVVKWFVKSLGKVDSKYSVVAYSNRVCFESKGGKEIFSGYEGQPILKNGRDKLKFLKHEAELEKAKFPLVIGHDENDMEIINWAKNRGGIAIGLAPEKMFRDIFDVIVTKPSWNELNRFIGSLV